MDYFTEVSFDTENLINQVKKENDGLNGERNSRYYYWFILMDYYSNDNLRYFVYSKQRRILKQITKDQLFNCKKCFPKKKR